LNRSEQRSTEYAGMKTTYFQLKVLSKAYSEVLSLLFSATFYTIIITVILLSFLLVKGQSLPVFLRIMVISTDVIIFSFGYYIFSLATESNILSAKFIGKCKDSGEDSKFWGGMRPIRVGIGQVCSFETKEFLLVIWGEVVVLKLIDLLIAY